MPFNILAKNPGNWTNVSLAWLLEAWEERQRAALGNVEIPELPGQGVEEKRKKLSFSQPLRAWPCWNGEIM